jgi:cellulose biosynthesis protein BcsQ
MRPHFDTSIEILASVVDRMLGPEAVSKGLVLRDSSGRLTFFAKERLDPEIKARVSQELYTALGRFARAGRVIVDPADVGYSPIRDDPNSRSVRVEVEASPRFVRVLDKQIAGMDWLLHLDPELASPPRFVFASLKGGVGRSTALAVVAADQARKGRNVLVIDLDLEAPGVGSMLLNDDRRPWLGVLDFLVENALGTVPDPELDEFVGTSQLTAGAGLVDVLPVAGALTLEYPQHFLPKLARGMVEELSPEGEVVGFHQKIRTMVDRFVARRAYDLVLIDVRAGLAEIAAGPILALGARVFLFGTAQPQTIEGYRFLFAQLETLRRDEQSVWPARNFQMIHAKGSMAEETHQAFKDELWNLFSEYIYEELEPGDLEGFNFDVDDPDAPHNPILIPHDAGLVDWDPVKQPSQLDAGIHKSVFGHLIEKIEDGLTAAGS